MDYYNILGVNKSASDSEIKKAFKAKSMQYHPDRGGDAEKFKEINEAYQTLKDPQKRAEYDNPPQRMNFNDAFGGDFQDIFSQMFGGAGPRRQRNKDILCTAQIELLDVIKGKHMDIQYQLPTGTSQTAKVNIPPGIDSNVTMRYPGLGDNTFRQLPRGDLLIKVVVRNPRGWARDGFNLLTFVEVDAFDAMLGTKRTIRTLEDKMLQLTIPAGTQPDQIFSITDHGIVDQRSGRRGSIYVKVKINVPKLDDNMPQDVLNYIKEARDGYSKVPR